MPHVDCEDFVADTKQLDVDADSWWALMFSFDI